MSDDDVRVALLGWGAIGRTVGLALARGAVPGARLVAVSALDAPEGVPAPVVAAEDLAREADLVIEAAGQDALRRHGRTYLEEGVRLLVVSVGALVDDGLFQALVAGGADRLAVTTGAIGGLDLLAAARRAGPIEDLTLTTTKQPAVLIQDWMDPDLVARLEAGEGPVCAFDGPASQAVSRFPQSVNVAATLALAVGSWEAVRVRVVGDPTTAVNRHEIAWAGAAGRYALSIENHPSPENPKTSGIVPHAVLRSVAALVGRDWRLV